MLLKSTGCYFLVYEIIILNHKYIRVPGSVSPGHSCSHNQDVRTQTREIFTIFCNMKVYCVFSLESPHQGDSNEYTQYTIFNIKKSHLFIPNMPLCDFFSKGLKDEFETAVVNEPLVLEPLKFYCKCI